jgi:oligopeptide/dipeptide ABC transporter ATP-binding protein
MTDQVEQTVAPGARVPQARRDPAAAASHALEAVELSKRFPLRSSLLRRVNGHVEALRGVTVRIGSGECVALVGESGSGKSTLARCVVGLERPESGAITVGPDGRDAARLSRRELALRVQIVFQDPVSALSPRMTLGSIVGESFAVHRGLATRAEARERVAKALDAVGIPPAWRSRFPHQLSGGQRQRVAIARALVLRPELLVLDEPVSALDASMQAQILSLLGDLRRRLGVAYLLVSHELSVVRLLADQVYVIYRGVIVEHGTPTEVLSRPRHPYTAALIEAEPSRPGWDPDGSASASRSAIGDAGNGCVFAARCPRADAQCRDAQPPLIEAANASYACYHPIPSPITVTPRGVLPT